MIKKKFIGFCSRKMTVIFPGHPVIPPEVHGALVCFFFFFFGGPNLNFSGGVLDVYGVENLGEEGRKQVLMG